MTTASNEGTENVHILIVEDSPTQAVKLEHLLAEHGHVVSVTKNGGEALEFLKSKKPDLIISDIIMPVMDGYELCRIIKADSVLSSIPVILLTSLSDPGEVINGLKCGADNFITKPYEEQFILSRIAQVLANREFRQSGVFEPAIEIYFAGKTHDITSSRFQIIELLLSTFENAIEKNRELDEVNKKLRSTHDELKKTNTELHHLTLELDNRVAARTEELEKKSEEIRIISQQLLQAEKLATMGELAASIAHELNNPLATVSLRVESLLEKTPEDSTHQRELKIIEQEIERMSNLIANLLQFSRRSRPQISTVDVCEEIEKTLELIYYHLRKHTISIMRQFARDVPQIQADRQQLRQLFLNLFTNAIDAMPRGGMMTIVVAVNQEGKQMRIEIADTGTGIPPEILSKVTEPFYTTKPEGKGTGLGLAICRRIAQGHQGTIEITSDAVPGKGTRVCLTLPVTDSSTVDYLCE
jgi:signal transduction histidine kinase